MPYSHLMLRKNRYYLNIKVPPDIRSALGKEHVRVSLKTSDLKEAKKRLNFELSKVHSQFEAASNRLSKVSASRQKRSDIDDQELHGIVTRFFVQLEKGSEKWWQEEGRRLTPEDAKDVIDTLQTDELVYQGGTPHYREAEGDNAGEVDQFLKSEGIELSKDSSGYRRLVALFRQANLENVRRSIDRLNRANVRGHDPLFVETYAHTEVSRKKRTTIGDLVKMHEIAISNAKRSSGTLKTYAIPWRLLPEILGADTFIDSVTTTHVEKVLNLLSRVPSNVTKRYKGMSISDAIVLADKKNDPARLKSKTLQNYLDNISSTFNFAVTRKLIDANPFKDPLLRASVRSDESEGEKTPFTYDQVNRIFKAPLYTGCVDDDRNYAKIGDNRPRRGRFWVPLISLFHGLRLNEAAQLYIEDIGNSEGIYYFNVRENLDQGAKSDKRLKSKQSVRKVPFHSRFLKLGFLEFVELQKSLNVSPRLFPDLPCGETGYYSGPFSKWFGRFKAQILGDDCSATFHSFRHLFRTALGDGGATDSEADVLGGWDKAKRSSEKVYDHPSMRRLQTLIEKAQFPELDILHLEVEMG